MLPPTILRCPGEMHMASVTQPADCRACARRTEGIRDYMTGAEVEWMLPPGVVPCPERLEAKK